MGKKRVGKNLWKFDVHVFKSGRYRTKKSEEFKGTSLEADMELLRIRKRLIDKKNKNNQKHVLLVRKLKDVLSYYKAKHPLFDKSKKSQLSIYNNLMLNLGECPIEEIWEGLEAFVDKMKVIKSKKFDRIYAAATINRRISMVKASIRLAYNRRIQNRRWIPENYLQGFKTLDEKNVRFHIISGNAIAAINSFLPEKYRPIHYFASIVPCRISELRQLKKKHMNLFERLIHLPLTMSKNDNPRFLPINDDMVPYFESLKNIPCEYLFHKFSKKDKKYSPIGDFRWSWKNACKKAGVNPKEYNFHKTRQQSAMGLLYDGYSTEEVMLIGGWLSKDAFERYCRVDAEMIKRKLRVGKGLDNKWIGDVAPKAQRNKKS